MRWILVLLSIFAWSVIQAGGPAYAAPIEIPEKHELDESRSRHLVLENGLKVLLISDPKYNVSAAALEVGVGSLSDPREYQGLAHFLEHMLFLGTEKYPDVDSYMRFLESRGGYANAFTSGDHTNYHFSVHHDALEEALDRFSQFFVAPLFDMKYVEREMKAVHSEHQKNLQNDEWRLHQLMQSKVIPSHPENHFGTGNLETLAKVDRETLLHFYHQYYSANSMGLAVLSRQNLDALEAHVRKYFSVVENRKLERPRFPEKYLETRETFRLLRVEPVMDLRRMVLEFALPPSVEEFRSKPLTLISHCIGHEGRGSLLSRLKELGLATGLSAGGYENTMDYGSFTIAVELTERGLERYREVVELSLAYIEELRSSPIPDHVFDEVQTMLSLEKVFGNRGEGAGVATDIAARLTRYPIEKVLDIPYLLDEKRPDLFVKFLRELRPDNMLCILTAKGLEVDKTEPIYGTRYSEVEDAEFYKKLILVQKDPSLHLPEVNPFLPQSVDLLSKRPVQIVDEPGMSLWYLADEQFRSPKVALTFKLRWPASRVNLESAVLMDLYGSSINEQFNEYAYPAEQAGLGYSISAGLEGVTLHVSGYSSSALELLEEIVRNLQKIRIDEKRFSNLKDAYVRSLRDFPKSPAWQIARHRARKIRWETVYEPEDMARVAEGVRLQHVRDFSATVFQRIYMQGLVHGNLSQTEAERAARSVLAELTGPSGFGEASRRKLGRGVEPLSRDLAFEQRYLVMSKPESTRYVEKLSTNNSSFYRFYYLDESSPRLRATAQVLSNLINQPFYTEMRTEQQLGYIVWSVASDDKLPWYLYFIIQSASHPAHELAERAEKCIQGLGDQLAALPAEEFEAVKASLVETLKEKSKSIAEEAGRMFSLTFNHDLDFERVGKEIAALKDLKLEEVVALLRRATDPSQRRMFDILLYAEEHPIPSDLEAITDLEKFVRRGSYRNQGRPGWK